MVIFNSTAKKCYDEGRNKTIAKFKEKASNQCEVFDKRVELLKVRLAKKELLIAKLKDRINKMAKNNTGQPDETLNSLKQCLQILECDVEIINNINEEQLQLGISDSIDMLIENI